jgi:hypothetical protein
MPDRAVVETLEVAWRSAGEPISVSSSAILNPELEDDLPRRDIVCATLLTNRPDPEPLCSDGEPRISMTLAKVTDPPLERLEEVLSHLTSPASVIMPVGSTLIIFITPYYL